MRRLATLILSLWGIALSHAALEIPKALPATDITENSFTANWQSISQASAYNLNVFAYKMEDCGTETVKVTESFEGLVPRSSGSKRNKYIDSNLSVFPENWKIDVNTGSIRQLYTTNVAGDTTSVYSGKIALAFDATGDSIVTPVLPAPASKFSFWIKNANATGTVAVYGFDGFQWHSLGEASTISYRSGGIADFSANIPVGCIQIKMIYTDENPDLNSPTAIDEISYTYGGIVKTRDYLVKNKRITETSAPVTGLKDNTDYFYTVKSTNDSETSLESNMIDVFGYAGSLSKPVLKEFTDIQGGNTQPTGTQSSGPTDMSFTMFIPTLPKEMKQKPFSTKISMLLREAQSIFRQKTTVQRITTNIQLSLTGLLISAAGQEACSVVSIFRPPSSAQPIQMVVQSTYEYMEPKEIKSTLTTTTHKVLPRK